MAISVLKTDKNTKKYLHLPLCFKICHVLSLFSPATPAFFLNDTVVLEKSSGVSCCTSESFITMSLWEAEPDVQTTVICPRKPASVSHSWPWNWTWGSDSIKDNPRLLCFPKLGLHCKFPNGPCLSVSCRISGYSPSLLGRPYRSACL